MLSVIVVIVVIFGLFVFVIVVIVIIMGATALGYGHLLDGDLIIVSPTTISEENNT